MSDDKKRAWFWLVMLAVGLLVAVKVATNDPEPAPVAPASAPEQQQTHTEPVAEATTTAQGEQLERVDYFAKYNNTPEERAFHETVSGLVKDYDQYRVEGYMLATDFCAAIDEHGGRFDDEWVGEFATQQASIYKFMFAEGDVAAIMSVGVVAFCPSHAPAFVEWSES